MPRLYGLNGSGFGEFDRDARRAERQKQFPLTHGLVAYKTVRNVALAVAALLTLVTPKEPISSSVKTRAEGTNKKAQLLEPVSPVLATTPPFSAQQ